MFVDIEKYNANVFRRQVLVKFLKVKIIMGIFQVNRVIMILSNINYEIRDVCLQSEYLEDVCIRIRLVFSINDV